MILVGIVVLVFLQDWKAMILPMIDVPVSLIGTFAVMAAMGFSLNNLTLFGLVLAIGIVVDDAIVVLENIERLIATGLDSRTATIKAMEEITGPILAITLVLELGVHPLLLPGRDHRAVLPPVRGDDRRLDDHLGGQRPDDDAVAGRHDLQDRGRGPRARAEARGIALVVFRDRRRDGDHLAGPRRLRRPVSACRRHPTRPTEPTISTVDVAGRIDGRLFRSRRVVGGIFGLVFIRPINAVLGWLFRGFNRLFDQMTVVYGRIVGQVLRISTIVLVAYGGLLVLTYWQFNHAPTGFVPQQDKGYLLLNVQLPDSASVERTQRVMARIEALARETPGVEHTVGVSGQSLLLNANAPNLGSLYVMLKEFSRAARAQAHGRRHRRGAARHAVSARCEGRSSRRSAHRRSTAWARPAASS